MAIRDQGACLPARSRASMDWTEIVRCLPAVGIPLPVTERTSARPGSSSDLKATPISRASGRPAIFPLIAHCARS